MITLRDFNDATSRKRNDMAKRLKPKYWRSGKRAGKLRRAGQSLPFSLEEFRAWCMKTMGFNTIRCHYCPRAIDILHFEPDHYIPLEGGGSPGLENLVAACEDCNRLKGTMLPADFIKLMRFLENDISFISAGDIQKRLRAGSMGIRLQYHLKMGDGNKKPPQPTHQLTGATKAKELFDDF
jgi:5-methylcytosine-specific restriction endonuclease McrA